MCYSSHTIAQPLINIFQELHIDPSYECSYAVAVAMIIHYIYAQEFACPEDGCTKSYSRKDNLLQHLRKYHHIPATKCGRFKCSVGGCQECYFHRTELLKHLRAAHDVHVGKHYKLH